jgi:hypothetical protein
MANEITEALQSAHLRHQNHARRTALFHRAADAAAIGLVEDRDGRRGRGQFHGFAKHFTLRHTDGSEVVGVHRSHITQ